MHLMALMYSLSAQPIKIMSFIQISEASLKHFVDSGSVLS